MFKTFQPRATHKPTTKPVATGMRVLLAAEVERRTAHQIPAQGCESVEVPEL